MIFFTERLHPYNHEFQSDVYVPTIHLAINKQLPKCAIINVGDGVTMNQWTDCYAGTVVKVSNSKQTIVVRRDNAERITEPEFVVGGFGGNCTNNNSIQYNYSPNILGERTTFTRRNNNRIVQKGSSKDSQRSLVQGRHEFYDYNF